MSLTRQIEAARVARERECECIRARMHSLEAAAGALMTEGWIDADIACIPRALTLHATLTGMSPTLPLLRRLAQHAIDAHCAARAAGERSAYDRADLEKYLDPSRHRPLTELRILADRLLPSEALTVLLSLLPPENE